MLRVPVTCSGRCDVRAVATRGTAAVSATTTGRLALPIPLNGLLETGRHTLRLKVEASAPGGRRAVTRHVRVAVDIRVPRPRPTPRPGSVVAHRSGNDVIVTFRVERAAEDTDYVVVGYRDRRASGPGVARTLVRGRARRSLRVRLLHAARARYVRVVALADDGGVAISTPVRIG
jgi:hypothetical protein